METENLIRHRIISAVESKGLKFNTLANGDSNLSRKIYKQLTEEKTLTYAVIEVVLSKIPDLSTEWLFRGIGEPFVTEQPAEQVPTDTPQWAREMETRLLAALSQPKKTEISNTDDTARNLSVKVSLE